MATRSLTDDQHADGLIYYLTILTQSVRRAVTQLEALMQEPASPEREQRMAEMLYALDRVNETAMHQGLGKSLRELTKEKQRVETQIAQQDQDRLA
jgi:uncharacterized alpha-E superfamily protein